MHCNLYTSPSTYCRYIKQTTVSKTGDTTIPTINLLTQRVITLQMHPYDNNYSAVTPPVPPMEREKTTPTLCQTQILPVVSSRACPNFKVCS
ncbi:hypothetical protein CDAR_169361 [Caerostris darwini]|uniref:Uncharacterized protein n=1 Tax=Caerostris darwini TaxID=1538125 RepID=A0AAV4QHG1_9ARAC|nr:hypothetical protein CDAR_169361 [Caerostris darwini]